MTKVNRKTKLSQFDLTMKSKVVIEAAKRDFASLSELGITESFLNEFENQVNELSKIKSYDLERIINSDITEAKDEARLQLIILLQQTRRRFALVFNQSHNEYIKYMQGDFIHAKNDLLLKMVTIVVEGLQKNLDQLSVVGITEATITEIKNRAAIFNHKLNLKIAAFEFSDNNTFERVEKINEVYENLLKLSNAGKVLWIEVNPAHYDDYVVSH